MPPLFPFCRKRKFDLSLNKHFSHATNLPRWPYAKCVHHRNAYSQSFSNRHLLKLPSTYFLCIDFFRFISEFITILLTALIKSCADSVDRLLSFAQKGAMKFLYRNSITFSMLCHLQLTSYPRGPHSSLLKRNENGFAFVHRNSLSYSEFPTERAVLMIPLLG